MCVADSLTPHTIKEEAGSSVYPVILGHPTGNQFFLNAALAFENQNSLHRLFTCVASCGNNTFAKLSRLPGLSEIGRRKYPEVLLPYLHLKPGRELFRLLTKRTGPKFLQNSEKAPFSVDSVYWSLDRTVSKYLQNLAASGTTSGIIYAYDDGAYESFSTAKSLGWKTILDLPIAYWETMQELLKTEAERYPSWAPTLLGDRMPEFKTQRKTEELSLADHVVCPSEFVRRSLPSHLMENKSVSVIPFGTPTISIQSQTSHASVESRTNRPFRLLFVGGMSQRKGLADIFAAMKLLGSQQIELHVLGDPLMGIEFYKKQFEDFIYHPTIPHAEVLELMQSCDALVLPSIVEGRAQVQQEAMACGLPLIVTANAGAEDLIDEGETGYLVPIRSPESIASAIQKLVDFKGDYREIRAACRDKANAITWHSYQDSLKNLTASISRIST